MRGPLSLPARRAAALSVVTTATLTGLLAIPRPAASADRVCGRNQVHLLARQGAAAVYELRDSSGTTTTELCDRNVRTVLSSGPPGEAVQRDSIAITARAVGYALESCSEDEDSQPPCVTIINRIGRRGAHALKFISAVDPTAPRSQITRLRIGPTGAMAWISCHRAGSTGGEADPITQHACAKTGRLHTVYAVAANAPDRSTPSKLAASTMIAPKTLAIGVKRVTWREGHALRNAPL